MSSNYLNDFSFLQKLDNEHLKTYYVKIIILNLDEEPIRAIEGRVGKGSSISINASSAIRRTCSFNFIAEDTENDLEDIDNLLAINRKVKVLVGFDNDIDSRYDKKVWFQQGIFVINQISFSHSNTGLSISVSCKDKMCLLNGESGGNFPTSVTFSPYTQYHADGTSENVESTFYEIIQTAVCNYGGESLDRILISDVPLRLKQLSHYSGTNTLYYNTRNNYYTTDGTYVANDTAANTDSGWLSFNFNEDVGYEYIDFVYPKELTMGMQDNVCGLLDTIIKQLGNYEYYYDIEGNFIFREKKNYLNNSYTADNYYRLDNGDVMATNCLNNAAVIDYTNYQVDFSTSSSVYTFDEGSGLIRSYSNTPSYTNIKNDYHIWGKDKNSNPIHYHVVLKEKPALNKHLVAFLRNDNGEYTGGIRLATPDEQVAFEYNKKNRAVNVTGYATVIPNEKGEYIVDLSYKGDVSNTVITIQGEHIYEYTPDDWRAEIYLQGLEKIQLSQRPDIYEQELLDNFNSIYEFCYYDDNKKLVPHGRFKEDVYKPNNLKYYIDYLEPARDTYEFSVDAIHPKIYTYQQDSIKRIYDRDTPNIIILDIEGENRDELIKECELNGQQYSNVETALYKKITPVTIGYSASEVTREAMYQHITMNQSISIQCNPIYYLDVNSRITVNDPASGIYGDYIINSITLPMEASGNMSISAIKAIERI